MRKNVVYEINIQVKEDGEILGCTCECAAGHSLLAHCKHVIVLFLALTDACTKSVYIVEKTCTEKLQIFHKPKRYHGSPVKLQESFSTKKSTPAGAIIISDSAQYQDYFRNIIISHDFNCNYPLKQLYEPANPYGVVLDHDYSKYSVIDTLLRSLKLTNISLEEVDSMEVATRNQASNPQWFEYRRHRLTASRFHSFCQNIDDKRGKQLALSILAPVSITNASTIHGKTYEKTALTMFKEAIIDDDSIDMRDCGLFVSHSHPFLGASPDALLNDSFVIEVKCPYSIKDELISENNLPDLEANSQGQLTLKKTIRTSINCKDKCL